MTITGTNVSMIRGDSEFLLIRLTDNEGTQIPFEAGDTVYFTLKTSTSTATISLQKTVTTFTAENEARIEILPTDTSSLYFQDYVYDVQWNQADGTVKTIIPPSTFTIAPEVTHD